MLTNEIQAFFERYEQGANTFDADLVRSQFTDCFLGGDPNGVRCVHNDETFAKAIPERKAFFEQIGFRSATVLNVTPTPLDERYTMVRVHWQMVFEKNAGHPQTFRFHITYFLFDDGQGPKVVFYVSHEDEQKVMREAGLLPED